MKNLPNIFAGFIAPIFGIYFSFLGFFKSYNINNKLGIYISLIVMMLSFTWIFLRLLLEFKIWKNSKQKD